MKTIILFLLLSLSIVPMASAADLSMVPQYGDNETEAERDQRLGWWRDAKFGLFIHWGVSSLGKMELGWGRRPPRPHDIGERIHGPATTDPVYDNLYKEFNPTKFDADALVKVAKAAGMKYIVIVTKHHDGFAMFDSKVSDYDIMATPYGKDIIGQVVEACHKNDMRIGLYYSTRDWWHKDYLVGDNKKYDEYYRAQVRELLTNYGKIDIMWFDSVGGQDWSKWDFESLFSMMYTLQPDLIINNRAGSFIGWQRPKGQNMPSRKIVEMTKGDYSTPEARIGEMNLKDDWESCMLIGARWGYSGEDHFQTPKTCIQNLVMCVTGGGNLLLNFGPRPDGTITDGELLVAKEMGKWLEHHGEAIYGTHAGPYHNGGWGGTTHRDNKMYVHIAQFPKGGLALDPIDNKVLSGRTLTGGKVDVKESAEELLIHVPPEDRDEYVTVVELTMEKPIETGTIVGGAKTSEAIAAMKGKLQLLTKNVTLVASGHKQGREVEPTEKNQANAKGDNVFNKLMTTWGTEPWAIVDLGKEMRVNLLELKNDGGKWMTRKMDLYTSLDGETWEKVWRTEDPLKTWDIPLTRFLSGADVPGRDVRYLKFVKDNDGPGQGLVLHGIRAFGDNVNDEQ